MSKAPYADAWRERTLARMAALGLDAQAVDDGTGFRGIKHALHGSSCVDLEIAGPVDELLDKLEDQAEAETIADDQPARPARVMRAPRRGEIVPVACDLEALIGCDVVLPRGRP